jgi:hypothetical protein
LSAVWLGEAEVGYPARMTTPRDLFFAGCRYPAEHQLRGLAVFPVPAKPAHGRGDARRSRPLGHIRDDPPVGLEIRPRVRQPHPSASPSPRQVQRFCRSMIRSPTFSPAAPTKTPPRSFISPADKDSPPGPRSPAWRWLCNTPIDGPCSNHRVFRIPSTTS